RITTDPRMMTGRPCIRDTRIPVSVILKLLAKKESYKKILTAYQELEEEDILACLEYNRFCLTKVKRGGPRTDFL
ncbi:MAG: DUF433 domain-containing protein, partial [Candidatus Hodarchaeales archaeon]